MLPTSSPLRRKSWSEGSWQGLCVASLVVAVLGLLLPWITEYSENVSGLHTALGKLFGGLVVATAVSFGYWRARSFREAGLASLLCSALMVALAIFELIHVSSSYDMGLVDDPGLGLIIDVLSVIVTTWTIVKLLRWKRTPFDGDGGVDELP